MNISECQFDKAALNDACNSVSYGDGRPQVCEELGIAFVRSVDDDSHSGAKRFLAIICSWRLKADDMSRPFDCLWHESTWDDISKDQLEIMSQTVPQVADTELRARLSDILWLRTRNHIHARSANQDYVKSAESLIHSQHYSDVRVRLARALQLAAQVEKRGELYVQTVERISALAELPELHPCAIKSCLDVLLEQRRGDARRLHQLASNRAKELARQKPDTIWERNLWELAAGFAEGLDDHKLLRDCVVEVARTYERDATAAQMQSVAMHFWTMALHSYRRIGDTNDERARAQKELLSAQERALSEIPTITSGPIDISELVQQAQERIRDKEKYRALAELVMATRWLPKAYVQEQAEASLKRYPLQHMFATTQLSSTGKVAATAPPGPMSSEQAAPERLLAEMCQQYQFFIKIVVNGTIDPMRYELFRAHNVTMHDMLELLRHSPLIPPGRVEFFVRGLYAGLNECYLDALHILVPQLEHFLRYSLNQEEVITSGFDKDGIQNEFDLNRLLYMAETEKLLGTDLSFALRVLLVERFGSNLRNHMAHGMLTAGSFYAAPAIYTWWVFVRMFLGPVANQIIAGTDEANDLTAQNASQKGGDQS